MPFPSHSVISQSAGKAKISDILLGAHISKASTDVVNISLDDNCSSRFEKISAIAITDLISGNLEWPSSEES